ncbi:MAG: serine/threonine protein kinase [Kiritimatiellae bacterium]|nr:serine/threonine protein kinase [Kiritimatiellia bacterium]
MDLDLNGYDSFEKVGQGGMATVWKARQISLDRPVAIKILTSSNEANDEDIDQFQSEARVAASLNHSGIVQVYDAFYRNNLFCFVMEFVDGQTISQWIKSRGRLTESECLFVAKGVATALDYAWNFKNLVHCDIKPDNVMIDSDGTVKVTDLGLCRGIGTISTRKMIRESNNPEEIVVFGTPSFVSPEQALGRDHLQPQADMYSLGAMLYNMILGRYLFSSNEIDKVMELQVTSQDDDIYDHVTDVTPMFCDFIERLLSKQIDQRYETWGDVLIDIERISHNCPLAKGPLDLTKAVSTMRRSERRLQSHHTYATLEDMHMNDHSRLKVNMQKFNEAYAEIEFNKIKKRMYKKITCIASAITIVVLALGIAIGFVMNKPKKEVQEKPVQAKVVQAKVGEDNTELITKAFEEVNKKHFSGVITDSDALKRYDEFLGVPNVDQQAINRIKTAKNDIKQKFDRRKRRVLNELKKKAEFMAMNGDVIGAVNSLEYYDGDFAKETAEERMAFSKDIAKRYKNK